MRIRTYTDRKKEATHSETGIAEAEVVSQQPGTPFVDVRLTNSGNRIIRRVRLPENADAIETGQLVLVAKTINTGWVLICAIQDAGTMGLRQAVTGESSVLYPPNNVSAFTVGPLLICQWEAWPGASICYQLEHAATSTAAYGTRFLTRGSYFLYPTEEVETRYFRVRAVQYDARINQSYYSGWSAWVDATSVMFAESEDSTSVAQNLTKFMEHEESQWDKHLIGEM